MNDLSEMKGRGRSIVNFISGTDELDLVEFLDGSIGIEKNKKNVGIWECGEKNDGLDVFVAMVRNINPSAKQLFVAMKKTLPQYKTSVITLN